MSTGKGESEDSDKSFTMIYFRAWTLKLLKLKLEDRSDRNFS
jgi:hypothetical protein